MTMVGDAVGDPNTDLWYHHFDLGGLGRKEKEPLRARALGAT